MAYKNRSDPCGCWCALHREEGYCRKHQESIRESYYDRDSKDLPAGICANPQKGSQCMNRMIDSSDWRSRFMVCTRLMHKKNTGKDCDKRDNNKNNNNKYPLLALTTDSELMSSKMILLRTITIILRANDWTYCCYAVLPTNFFEGIFLDLVETLICSKRFAKLILFLYLKPFCTKTHLTLFSADLWTCWLNKVTQD